MKTRAELFDLLTSAEPVTVEEYLPYSKSLKILLEDYRCEYGGILCKYLGGYGTVFYIPSKDLHEECMSDYMEGVEEYDEDEYQEFSQNWFASVGLLPEYPTTNNLKQYIMENIQGEFVNDGNQYQFCDYVFIPFTDDEGFINLEIRDFDDNLIEEIAGVEIPDGEDTEEMIKFEKLLTTILKGLDLI